MSEKYYGELPVNIGRFNVQCKEMMFYQYLPIKLIEGFVKIEERLSCFSPIINAAIGDFIKMNGFYGENGLANNYVYLTAKHLYQPVNQSFNRGGYHSDGFMTNDINYIWCDRNPTIFNSSKFKLTQDDILSLKEMEDQALLENVYTHPVNSLLRLDQYNIHRVADNLVAGMRTFVKVSFSKERYDLVGNSHNYQLDYHWNMRERREERNVPQLLKSE